MDQPAPPHDEAWLALGRTVLLAQPLAAWLGVELTQLSPGHAELQLALLPQHRQPSGPVHGSVVACLVDHALSFAGGSVLGADGVLGTFTLNHTQPAAGTRLVARATALHAGRTQAVCRCDVSVIDESKARALCATALGTVVRAGAR